MKNVLILIVLLASFHIQAQTWNLVWSDEFNYSGLPDATKWGNEIGYVRNNELQYYTAGRLDNTVVKNGSLLIIGKKESYNGYNYTSASLTTINKFNWSYGKFEARMKLPKGNGMWPAFWLLGQNSNQVSWPYCGEIDIMEHINTDNAIFGTMHWYNNGQQAWVGAKSIDDVSQYHIYSIEWDKNTINWLIDGIQFWTGDISNNVNNTGAFHNPFYMILNLAIGGSWPGNPDATTLFPDTLSVDYVRVYQKATTSINNISLEDIINVFPNPARDIISIEIPEQYGDGTLSVTDLTGKKLITKHVYNKNTQISLSNLSTGIYVLKFSNDLNNFTSRIIKKE